MNISILLFTITIYLLLKKCFVTAHDTLYNVEYIIVLLLYRIFVHKMQAIIIILIFFF